SSELFKAFAEEFAKSKKQLKGKLWEKLATNKKPGYPVMGVYVNDAHEFAVWLGGKLPLVQQWDKACGSYVKTPAETAKMGKGPSKGSEVAIGRLEQNEPLPFEETPDDVSAPYGMRDAAGNGREWTRELWEDTRQVPVEPPPSPSFVVVRGWSFRKAKPLTYEGLAESQKNPRDSAYSYSGTIREDEHDRDIGFRVVIEPLR